MEHIANSSQQWVTAVTAISTLLIVMGVSGLLTVGLYKLLGMA